MVHEWCFIWLLASSAFSVLCSHLYNTYIYIFLRGERSLERKNTQDTRKLRPSADHSCSQRLALLPRFVFLAVRLFVFFTRYIFRGKKKRRRRRTGNVHKKKHTGENNTTYTGSCLKHAQEHTALEVHKSMKTVCSSRNPGRPPEEYGVLK